MPAQWTYNQQATLRPNCNQALMPIKPPLLAELSLRVYIASLRPLFVFILRQSLADTDKNKAKHRPPKNMAQVVPLRSGRRLLRFRGALSSALLRQILKKMVAALIRSAESLFFKYLAGPGVSALLKGVGKLTRSFSPYQLGRAKGARALGERQSARGAPERVRAVRVCSGGSVEKIVPWSKKGAGRHQVLKRHSDNLKYIQTTSRKPNIWIIIHFLGSLEKISQQ